MLTILEAASYVPYCIWALRNQMVILCHWLRINTSGLPYRCYTVTPCFNLNWNTVGILFFECAVYSRWFCELNNEYGPCDVTRCVTDDLSISFLMLSCASSISWINLVTFMIHWYYQLQICSIYAESRLITIYILFLCINH